jgi:peptide deformylase
VTAAGEHRAGSVRSLATVGDPVLREGAREITPEELRSPEVQGLVDDLIATMRAAGGAGLVANQVGELRRVAVVEVDHNPRYPYKPPVPLTVIVNPVLEPVGDETAAINEGYLSVPDLRGTVDRHVAIRLRHVGRDGVERDEVRRGLTAGTFQHEVDRLDGVLFLDRVRDPTTFTTWEQFDRHDRDAFVARARALAERVGS